MRRRTRDRAETETRSEANRRQFLSGLVAGAALTACGEHPQKMTGTRPGEGPIDEPPRPDARAANASPDAGAGKPPPDASSPPPIPLLVAIILQSF